MVFNTSVLRNRAATPECRRHDRFSSTARTDNSISSRRRSDQMTGVWRLWGKLRCLDHLGWLGSRVVSVLDSGAEGPGLKSQPRCCPVTVLGKLFTPIVPVFTKQQKLVAALLRVAGVTAGLAESNGSLPPGLWLTSPAGWLSRTGISSGTIRFAIEYGLPLPFLLQLRGSLFAVMSTSWLDATSAGLMLC